MTSLRVPARPEFLENLRSHVLGEAAEAGASESLLFRIELATEEAFTNIVKYAYPQDNGEVEVDCTTSVPLRFTVIVRDWGIPFNPLSCGEPDIAQDFADRPVGGLGIYLIRKMSDQMTYCPQEDGNQLTLCFFIDRPPIET